MSEKPRTRTFTTYGEGILHQLCNLVHVFSALDSSSSGKEFRAAWDTGATGTCVSPQVVKSLGLKPTGHTLMSGVNKTTQVSTYKVNLLLPDDIPVPNWTVSETGGLTGGVDLLIGMDIISCGNFVVSTWRGKTSFSFQFPTDKRIDLLPKSSRRNIDRLHIKVPGIGRNEPCRCGSGNKYKYCCGTN